MNVNNPYYSHALAERFKATSLFAEMTNALGLVQNTPNAERRIADTYVPGIVAAMRSAAQNLELWHTSTSVAWPSSATTALPRYGLFNHPGRKDGEVFVGDYDHMGAGFAAFETKRVGEPYDDGLRGPNESLRYPLFISIEEAKRRKIV